jgi:hypothetical protein
MVETRIFLRTLLVSLLVGSAACKPRTGDAPASNPASGEATSKAPTDEQISQLKEKLWQAIRAKDAQKFVDCFFIEERFNTPTVRDTNLKQIEYLLGRETIDIVIEEIPPDELAEIRKIQKANHATMRYSLDPQKMILIRQKAVNGSSGRRFLIGEQSGQWYIVTMAGHTT